MTMQIKYTVEDYNNLIKAEDKHLEKLKRKLKRARASEDIEKVQQDIASVEENIKYQIQKRNNLC